MSLRTTLVVAGTAAAAALAVPAAAIAAPQALPSQVKTAQAAQASGANTCADGLRASRSTDRLAYTAPVTGFLSVRTAGGAASDWDLALHDARTKRMIGASQGFGSREVVQTWVKAGQKVVAQACRVDGRTGKLQVRFNLVKTALPTGDATASLINVEYRTFEDLELLEKLGADVTHQHGKGKADVIVPSAKVLGAVRATGLKFDMEVADIGAMYREVAKTDARNAKLSAASDLPSGRTTYRTYEDIQAELKDLVDGNEGLVKPVVLPKPSFQGRDVTGIEISTDVDATDDGKPVFFLMGVHHAREWPAAEANMEFAQMLTQDKAEPRIKALLDRARIVIVPLINPDGFVASRGALVSPGDITGNGNVQTGEGIAPPGGTLAYRRKNCNGAIPSGDVPCELQYGIDPNRNYGEGWGGRGAATDVTTQSYRGPGPWSEPETQNVHEYSQSRQVTGLVTVHTVGAQVLRPPGLSAKGNAPDEKLSKSIGDYMGQVTGWESIYSFQLYDTSGTTEDWNYAAAGTLGYTIEMGPKGGQFHGPYQRNVIDQWEGNDVELEDESAPKGMREALLATAETTTAATTRGTLVGTATPGATLRVKRTFQTKTGVPCTYAQGYVNSTGVPKEASIVGCVAPGAVQQQQSIDDKVETTTVVRPDGTFNWAVGPSTRPFEAYQYNSTTGARERKAGTELESWTLTCDVDGQQVGEAKQVVVDRGETVRLEGLCS